MDKYLALDKRLHDLKGLEVFRLKVDGVEHGGWITKDYRTAPRYCRDWHYCGPLMVEHEITPIQVEAFDVVVAEWGLEKHERVEVKYLHHQDKDTAVRCAIVQAVIAKLERAGQ